VASTVTSQQEGPGFGAQSQAILLCSVGSRASSHSPKTCSLGLIGDSTFPIGALVLPDGGCCRYQGLCEPTAGAGSVCGRGPTPPVPLLCGELWNEQQTQLKAKC